MPTVALKRALATYRAHTAVYRHVRLLFLVRLESYLNAAGLSGALHSGGDVNGVAPNIIVWFSGSDDSGSYRAVINPCIQEQQPYLLHQHRFINACPLVSSNIDHCFYDKWNGWIEMIPVIDLQVELASPNHSIKLIVKKREETKKKKEGQVHLIVRFFDRFTRKKNGESGPETNQQPVPFSIWFVWSMIGFNQSLFEVVSRWMIEIWVGWEIILPIRRMKWLKLWSLMHCNVFCMDKANSTRSDKCFQSSAESASSCSRVH